MSASALNFTCRYPRSSSVVASPNAQTLQLATCSAGGEHPHFFHGRSAQPRSVADMLLALLAVVRAHYFLPRPPPRQSQARQRRGPAKILALGGSGGTGVGERRGGRDRWQDESLALSPSRDAEGIGHAGSTLRRELFAIDRQPPVCWPGRSGARVQRTPKSRQFRPKTRIRSHRSKRRWGS